MRTRPVAVLSGLVLAVAVAVPGGGVTAATRSAADVTSSPAADVTSAPAARSCRVAAAGDVAGGDDWRRGAKRTGRLIRAQRPSRVIALGDLAYDDGRYEDFQRWYRPTWGAFKRKTLVVPGNHEYHTRRAAGLVRYFGASSVRNRSVALCHGWRVLLLNIYSQDRDVSSGAVRRAAAFVRADARRHPRAKLIAAWHVPRFSSGDEHGNDSSVSRLWNAAVAARVQIVLNAHDHHYERFRPTGRGRTVQFISGLGGHHLRPLDGDGPVEGSARHFTGTPAVLFLQLRSTGYSWAARTVTGRVVDRGTRSSPARR